MHYDSMAFTRNGRETLLAKQPLMTKIIGSAINFSPIDLTKIKKMYQCMVIFFLKYIFYKKKIIR